MTVPSNPVPSNPVPSNPVVAPSLPEPGISEPTKAPLLGLRSFTIIGAGAGILAYPVGNWFGAVAGAVMTASALHSLLGS